MFGGKGFSSARVLLGVGASALLLPFLRVDWHGDIGPCNALSTVYVPDLEGSGRTTEASWKECSMRCADTAGCSYFAFWPDGGCHISGSDAVAKPVDAPVIAGPGSCTSLGQKSVGGVVLNISGGGIPQNMSARSALELWKIDGAYYDLTPLLSKGHPGGKLPLLQTRGTDVSVLFRVQHLGPRPRLALDKYLVKGNVVHGDLVKQEGDLEFSFKPDGFYETVKGRVRDHLSDKIGSVSPRKASSTYLAKLAVHVVLFTGSWFRVIFFPMDLTTVVACFVQALSRVELTGMAHDAIHGILMPESPFLQSFFHGAVFRGFINFESERWHSEHVIYHHPYTKTGIDPDENLQQNIPFWRLTNATSWEIRHSFPLSTHLGFAMTLPILNAGKELHKLISPFAFERAEAVSCVASVFLFHLTPFLFRPRREAMAAVAITSMLPGLTTVLAFHVSHLAPNLEVNLEPGVDWGEHQMRTSSNFIAPIGGTLDLQIEHHLFPMLSYENQQMVVPIVKQTAQQFGIPYNCYESFLDGVYRHLSYMVELGGGSQYTSVPV